MSTVADVSQHVKEVLNRNNIQTRSLEFIPLEIKEQFFTQHKKAILLVRNKVFEREINQMGITDVIDVFDTELIPYLKKGQFVLLVMPTGGVKRYILQTRIDNIFVDRFRLVTLDPRHNKRFSFARSVGVRIRPVCDATVIRYIQTGEVRPVRNTDGVLPDAPLDNAGQTDVNNPDRGFAKHAVVDEGNKKEGCASAPSQLESDGTNRTSVDGLQHKSGSIRDILCRQDGDEKAEDFVRLEGQTPIEGTIVDMSCGGMCVSCGNGAGASFFVDQLMAIECVLEKGAPPPAEAERLHLFVLAIVRNNRKIKGIIYLNLQFLSNLPTAVLAYC
jgi:urease gamma subunit